MRALVEKHLDWQPGSSRQGINSRSQRLNAVCTLRGHDPELSHMGADRITGWVTWRTRKSRVRCRTSVADAASLFTATNRIDGRVTASQIAAASAASVLPRLT